MELRRAGISIKLRDPSSHILAYLLEHAGQMVTREELRLLLGLQTLRSRPCGPLWADSADKPLYLY